MPLKHRPAALEGVGLDDLGAGVNVGAVGRPDEIGLLDVEQLERPARFVSGRAEGRPHRTIADEEAFAQPLGKPLDPGLVGHGNRLR